MTTYLEETASVIAIQGQQVTVEVAPSSTCAGCSAKSGCGNAILAAYFPKKNPRFTLHNELTLQIGNKVIIGIPEYSLLHAATQLYLLPLLALIFGAFLAKILAIPGGELGQISMAALSFFITLRWLRSGQAKNQTPRYQPVILARAALVENAIKNSQKSTTTQSTLQQ